MNLALQNFATYSLQIGLLVALGGSLPFVFRLTSVRARLAWFQTLLAACVLLPLVQPWKQLVADGSISITTGAVMLVNNPATAARPFPWAEGIAAVLACGMAARLGWLAIGFVRLRHFMNASTLYDCPLVRSMEVHAYVGLSEEVSSPVTFGWRRPVILFPIHCAAMAPEMQESIACHELLHVQRRDWLLMMAEELIRAVFWFHPAIWWLLGEIHLTREQVVDQEVVRLTRARQPYLNALVEIASARTRLDLAPAPLFLRKRHLSQRVAQILREVSMSRTRIAATMTGISAATLVAGWLMVHSFPLQAAPQERAVTRSDAAGVTVEQADANLLHRAPVEYPAAAKAQRIEGTVVLELDIDESGNVSDARVLSGQPELRKAALESVLQWHYSKDMSLPAKTQVRIDFKLPPVAANPKVKPAIAEAAREARIAQLNALPAPILKAIDLSALPDGLQKDLRDKLAKYEGQPLAGDIMPEMIRTIQSVDSHLGVSLLRGTDGSTLRIALNEPGGRPAIWAKDAPPAGGEAPSTPQRIRVGGNVQQAMLISQVRPAYPPEAKQQRVQGLVRLNAIIGKDGTVKNLDVVEGDPMLVPSALDAVKQWVYKVTLLNGEPVEVMTVIDVNYTLSK